MRIKYLYQLLAILIAFSACKNKDEIHPILEVNCTTNRKVIKEKNGQISQYILYEHYGNSLIKKATYYDKDDVEIKHIEYTLDAQGYYSVIKSYNRYGDLLNFDEYSYPNNRTKVIKSYKETLARTTLRSERRYEYKNNLIISGSLAQAKNQFTKRTVITYEYDNIFANKREKYKDVLFYKDITKIGMNLLFYTLCILVLIIINSDPLSIIVILNNQLDKSIH